MNEEIDLTGKSSKPTSPVNPAKEPDKHTPDLSSEIENLTNEQLLNYYINTPEDKFNPWEEASLPSRGLYYGWPDGVVSVKAMGTAAEKVLANQRLAQDGQSIDYLFRECVRLQNNMDPTELLVGDRVFLLFYLRGITHGNMYEFMLTCPNDNCKESSTHEYDLNNLAETIIYADPSLGREPFQIVLPHISAIFKRDISVGLKFLRAYDLNDIIAKRRARKKMFARPGVARNRKERSAQAADSESMLTENLAKMIVNVAGVSDPYVIDSFVEKMHSRDAAEIREWMRDHTPGIDSTITVECPKCANEFNVELPITEGFFRPAKSARM